MGSAEGISATDYGVQAKLGKVVRRSRVDSPCCVTDYFVVNEKYSAGTIGYSFELIV